jgi:hypothetical protein
MRYQAIKHNKTGTRTLKVCDTLADAVQEVKKQSKTNSMRYNGQSYIGGFPTWLDMDTHKLYSVQGLNEHFGVVVSLDKRELLDATLYI